VAETPCQSTPPRPRATCLSTLHGLMCIHPCMQGALQSLRAVPEAARRLLLLHPHRPVDPPHHPVHAVRRTCTASSPRPCPTAPSFFIFPHELIRHGLQGSVPVLTVVHSGCAAVSFLPLAALHLHLLEQVPHFLRRVLPPVRHPVGGCDVRCLPMSSHLWAAASLVPHSCSSTTVCVLCAYVCVRARVW
jgi:hypothetical protein